MAAQSDSVLSHWSTLIENFQASPLAFFQAVEAAVGRREVPQTQNSRVDIREGGMLSAKREYLHITRERMVFDICGAPFGTGFFVSWWLSEDRLRLNPIVKMLIVLGMFIFASLMLYFFGYIMGAIACAVVLFGGLAVANTLSTQGVFNDNIIQAAPFIGSLYVRLFMPTTYFRSDTMEMFEKAVHNAVLEVIDTMTADKGVRALSESDRKPIMREFYAKSR
jgi:hypothetical protein